MFPSQPSARFSMRAFLAGTLALCLVIGAAACDSGSKERKPLREPAPVTKVKPELPKIVGDSPGKLGQEVAFNLGKASDYYNALTSFEMKATTEATVEGGGGPPGKTWQEVVVRQAHGDDYDLNLDLIVDGSAEYNGRAGFSAIRRDGYFYFKTSESNRYFRRKAKPSMTVSYLVPMDTMQGYLDFMQHGAKFVISRGMHLGRPARIYKIVEALPFEENPSYKGKPLSKSDMKGEIWVDEGSGLVVKIDFTMMRESYDLGAGPLKSVQHEMFELTKIGDIGPIYQPEDYYEGEDEFSPPEMKVPALLGDK